MYMGNVTGANIQDNTFTCRCQSFSFDSITNTIITGNKWTSVGNLSDGNGISSFTTRVSENVRFARNTIIGNPEATKRFESFTFDGSVPFLCLRFPFT